MKVTYQVMATYFLLKNQIPDWNVTTHHQNIGPLVLYITTRLCTCLLILNGEVRRISTFATFVRDGSHSTRTTFLCEIAVLRGRNAKECHSELTEALGNHALPYRTVARWAGAFQRVRVASADMHQPGRPRTVRTDVARAVIAQCLEDDRRVTTGVTSTYRYRSGNCA